MQDINQTNGNPLIRWGIIGCGDVTEVKSGPAYQQTDGFELVAVMRRDPEKARDYALRHGVPKVHRSADELIADPAVDAVYIATPPDSHLHYALKVAAAGKPCCIEKPMAPNYRDCEAINAAFDEKQVPLFVAYYRRSLPRFRQIKTWLDDRTIGEVRHVSWMRSVPANALDLSKEYNWRTDACIAAAGYFDDIGCHGLDLISFFIGDIKDAGGFCVNQQNLYAAKDAVVANWLHECGATGSGSWNFGSQTDLDRLEILGSKGMIEGSVFAEAPVRLSTEGGRKEVMIDHPKHIQLSHVQAMSDALLGKGSHPSTGSTATHTAWVVDKILGRI